MVHILHIDSSIKGEHSVTRQLTANVVTKLKQHYSDSVVTVRDVIATPIPHIMPEYLAGIFAGGDFANHDSVKLSDILIDEVFAADILVIGTPMYNFTIPSQLKAWIDHVLRARKTFRYSETGQPIGLVTGKKAIIVAAHGGIYAQGDLKSYDHVVPYMQQILGYIGITDTQIVRAEKQAMGSDNEQDGLAHAQHDIDALKL